MIADVTAIEHGVATISRRLKIVCLFCRISSLSKVSFAKDTYSFKEPTNRSQPILTSTSTHMCSSCMIADVTAIEYAHLRVRTSTRRCEYSSYMIADVTTMANVTSIRTPISLMTHDILEYS